MDAVLHHLRELWEERGRVGLVVLGVLWGTLSLTLLFAFGNEMVDATSQTSVNFGRSLLQVGSGATTRPHEGMPAGRWINRVAEDAEMVRAGVPGVDEVAVECLMGSGNPLQYGEVRMNVPVVGGNPSFGELRNQRPAPGGRFLNERDEAEHRRVIFLGHRTAARLFGAEDPVGRTVLLWNQSFLVVGVRQPLVSISSYSGDDRDKVTIPVSTFCDLFGWTRVSLLWVRFSPSHAGAAARQAVADDVFAVLAARHGIHPEDRDAVWMMDYVEEVEELVAGILGGLRTFLWGVGLIGLFVALVGVANVSYVMVEERTREIGVHMALGARPRDVALGRLAESILVTLTGGVLGIAATVGILAAMNMVELGPDVRAYLGRPTVSLGMGAMVVAMLVVGGSLAGWVPARRAAAMNPVEALREE